MLSSSAIKEYYATKQGFLVLTALLMIFLAAIFVFLAMAVGNWDISKAPLTVKQSHDDTEDSIVVPTKM